MTSLWKLSTIFVISHSDNGARLHKVCNDFNSVSYWVKWKEITRKIKKKFNEIAVCAKRDWETERKAFTFFGESNGHEKDFYPVLYTQFYQHTFAYVPNLLAYNIHTEISSIDIIIYLLDVKWCKATSHPTDPCVCIFVEFKRNAHVPSLLTYLAKYLLCM